MLFTDYLFENVKDIWLEYLNHKFLVELGKGTLDKEKFRRYLIQDYLYLKEYAKVYSMALVKSNSIKEMKFFEKSIHGILEDESATHIWYLKNFNEDIDTLEKYKISPANENYTNFMKSISLTGNVKEIMVAALPCAWSYYYIADKMRDIYKENLQDNFYKEWIISYSNESYKNLCYANINFTNELCKNIDEDEKEKLKEIFIKGSICEMEFWDMAYEEVK